MDALSLTLKLMVNELRIYGYIVVAVLFLVLFMLYSIFISFHILQ
mgnify:CR=1 FL=1